MLSMLRLWNEIRSRCLSPARTAELPPARLAERLAAGEVLQLVDLRSAEAFAAGHVPGAVNVPLRELLARIAELDRSAPTVVY
jgi:rhodanese-related sulfurtransferase